MAKNISSPTLWEIVKRKKLENPIFEFGSWRFDFKTIGGDPVSGISFTKHGMRRKYAILEILKEFPGATFEVHHAGHGFGMGNIPFKDIARI